MAPEFSHLGDADIATVCTLYFFRSASATIQDEKLPEEKREKRATNLLFFASLWEARSRIENATDKTRDKWKKYIEQRVRLGESTEEHFTFCMNQGIAYLKEENRATAMTFMEGAKYYYPRLKAELKRQELGLPVAGATQ